MRLGSRSRSRRLAFRRGEDDEDNADEDFLGIFLLLGESNDVARTETGLLAGAAIILLALLAFDCVCLLSLLLPLGLEEN